MAHTSELKKAHCSNKGGLLEGDEMRAEAKARKMESNRATRRNRNTGNVEGVLAGPIDDRDTGPDEGPILKV